MFVLRQLPKANYRSITRKTRNRLSNQTGAINSRLNLQHKSKCFTTGWDLESSGKSRVSVRRRLRFDPRQVLNEYPHPCPTPAP
jgi:hypothetical protein